MTTDEMMETIARLTAELDEAKQLLEPMNAAAHHWRDADENESAFIRVEHCRRAAEFLSKGATQ